MAPLTSVQTPLLAGALEALISLHVKAAALAHLG